VDDTSPKRKRGYVADQWELWFGRGKAFADLGRWTEAIADYSKAIELRPDCWMLWYDRAAARLNLGDWRGAIPDLSKVLEFHVAMMSVSRLMVFSMPPARAKELASSDVEAMEVRVDVGVSRPKAYCLRGLASAFLGRQDKAQADFAKATELEPLQIAFPHTHALACLVTGDLEGYRTVCGKTFEHFGQTSDLEVAHRLAHIAVLAGGGDPQKAIELAGKAVKSDPHNYQYKATLGAALYRAGLFQEAVQRLEEAIAEGPTGKKASSYSGAYASFFLAMAHHRLGRTAQSRHVLQKATELADQPLTDQGGNAGSPWAQRLILQVLRQEADILIKR
jgi:tetratricopeptide (TPR) repeat protein